MARHQLDLYSRKQPATNPEAMSQSLGSDWLVLHGSRHLTESLGHCRVMTEGSFPVFVGVCAVAVKDSAYCK